VFRPRVALPSDAVMNGSSGEQAGQCSGCRRSPLDNSMESNRQILSYPSTKRWAIPALVKPEEIIEIVEYTCSK
jgi:hypothetical protein